MEQKSDLFVEHQYFKLWDSIFFNTQWNIETSRFRKLSWLQQTYKLLFKVLHHITYMTGLC